MFYGGCDTQGGPEGVNDSQEIHPTPDSRDAHALGRIYVVDGDCRQ